MLEEKIWDIIVAYLALLKKSHQESIDYDEKNYNSMIVVLEGIQKVKQINKFIIENPLFVIDLQFLSRVRHDPIEEHRCAYPSERHLNSELPGFLTDKSDAQIPFRAESHHKQLAIHHQDFLELLVEGRGVHVGCQV